MVRKSGDRVHGDRYPCEPKCFEFHLASPRRVASARSFGARPIPSADYDYDRVRYITPPERQKGPERASGDCPMVFWVAALPGTSLVNGGGDMRLERAFPEKQAPSCRMGAAGAKCRGLTYLRAGRQAQQQWHNLITM